MQKRDQILPRSFLWMFTDITPNQFAQALTHRVIAMSALRVKIRFWLSTETFDIQRALNIQSFTLISFCYPLPLTNLNLLPFYELYTPSLIYN